MLDRYFAIIFFKKNACYRFPCRPYAVLSKLLMIFNMIEHEYSRCSMRMHAQIKPLQLDFFYKLSFRVTL